MTPADLTAEPEVIDSVSGERVDGPHFAFAAGPAAGPVMRERYAGVR